MSQTETKVVTSQKAKPKQFDVTELKTVKWISDVNLVKSSYEYAAPKYNAAKRNLPIISWIIGTIEMFFISIYLFIHSLPWPDWMMNIIFWFDQILENFLEFIGDKLDWWWDCIVIRLIWARDIIESVIDGLLSLGLFIVYKVIEMWMWGFSLIGRVLKFIFAPVIWVINELFPPPQKKKLSDASSSSWQSERSPSEAKTSNEAAPPKGGSEADEYMSAGGTSDCESDVSVVSETWSVGHTDRYGKSYNRVQMKATAEGRLRAAMYKRVKTQLTLMRKNSISFSRGMTSYMRQIFYPESTDVLNEFRNWVNNFTKSYGYEKLLDGIFTWIERHQLIAFFASLHLSCARVFVNVVQNLQNRRKKKSRRTRSMRSESLRRRNASSSAVVSPPFIESYGISLSKEPVVVEEPEFCTLQGSKGDRDSSKLEDEGSRDSAIASSIDDLCLASDSNESAVPLKNTTIVEEHASEQKETKVGDKTKNKKEQKLKSGEGNISEKNVNGKNTRSTISNSNLKKSTDKRLNESPEPTNKKEYKRLQHINENDSNSSSLDPCHEEASDDTTEVNNHQKKGSPKRDKGSYAEAVDSGEKTSQNGSCKEYGDSTSKTNKPPKRKISFSLTA